MRNCGILILILLIGNSVSAQKRYSEIIDLYNNSSDIFFSLLDIDDDIYVSIGNRCANFTTDCSALGKINIADGTVDWSHRLAWLDPGSQSIDQKNNIIEMSGHDFGEQSKFYLHKRSLNGDSLATFDLIPPNNLYDLNIRGNVTFEGYSIVFGSCRRKNNSEIPSLIFWVNEQGVVDTTMVIESGTILNHIKDMEIDQDGLLTVLVEFEEMVEGSNPYQIRRKQFLKYNENMELVWQWQTNNDNNFSPFTLGRFTILSDGTHVMPAEGNSAFAEEIWGIDNSGIKWKYKFPLGGHNAFSIQRLIEAKNGDIIGCGQMRDTEFFEGQHGFLFRMTHDGEMLWIKAIFDHNHSVPDKSYNSTLRDLKELSDGSIIASGEQNVWYYNAFNEETLGLDAWIVRTDADGCVIEDCGYVQDLVTSIPVISNIPNISIFPNPASNRIHLNTNKNVRIESIQLINSFGQVLENWEYSDYSNSLDVASFPRGMYFLSIKDKSGLIYTEKVLLQ